MNLEDTFDAAMTYVMLSRACSLSQILILNEFDPSKMYPNQRALDELDRLNKLSQNNNPSPWEKEDKDAIKICSLNCRSLGKHAQDIKTDDVILKSDIIFLNETWQESDETNQDLDIPDYELVLNSKGKGKGIATYFKKTIFRHDSDIKKDKMQLSKFTSSTLDIIAMYRSQGGSYSELNRYIEIMDSKDKPLLVIGDMNFCFLTSGMNTTKRLLKSKQFTQIIMEPTHIEGHLLDQAYLRDCKGALEWTVEVQTKYYTDHEGLAIMIKEKNNNVEDSALGLMDTL